MHWRALTQESAPRCRRLLSRLHSGPASPAASTPPTALHTPSSSLPSSNLSSAALSHPSKFVPFSAPSAVSWFPDVSLFPGNPRVSVCSSLQVQLHVISVTREGAERALWDQTKLPSAACIHMHWQTEQWDGQSCTGGWSDKLVIILLMP